MMQETQLQSTCCDLVADLVRSAGLARLRITGCSMLPVILPGDVLTVGRSDCDELMPGQIILYNRDGRLIAHRVIRVLDESLITRGDSLPAADMPVQFTEVVGRVEGILRNGRPVSTRPSYWQRGTAWILRHSEWSTSVFLRARSRLRRLAETPEPV
jgi:signal peptidase I